MSLLTRIANVINGDSVEPVEVPDSLWDEITNRRIAELEDRVETLERVLLCQAISTNLIDGPDEEF